MWKWQVVSWEIVVVPNPTTIELTDGSMVIYLLLRRPIDSRASFLTCLEKPRSYSTNKFGQLQIPGPSENRTDLVQILEQSLFQIVICRSVQFSKLHYSNATPLFTSKYMYLIFMKYKYMYINT